jgi:predicted nucleic-acid-binding protein
MIAVDTNVLVRYLVEDDAEQTRRAESLFRRALAAGEAIFVSEIVLCELVWVLKTAYRLRREEIVDMLATFVRAKQLELSDKDLIHRALGAFRTGRGDFADYVIRERARAAGCAIIATFDKQLWAEEGFQKI